MRVRARDLLVIALVTLSVCTAWVFVLNGPAVKGQWLGVDEAVISRFADAAGQRSPPLFDWVQGDLLLFAFLLAGLLAGFVLGFFSRSALGREEGAR